MRTSVFQSPSFYIVLLVFLCSPTSSHAFDGEPFKVGIVRDMFLAYASFDALVYNGTAWWAQWVNDQGGLVYNGSSHQVQVISVDASTPDPNQTTTRVNQGYESLVNDYKVNMLVSPYTTGRCQVAMNVAKKYKMINFVIAALTDSLFRSNDTWSFNEWIPSQKIATTSLAPLVAKGAKTFVVLRRPDTISMLTGAHGVEYLLSQGCTMLRDLWVNVTSTDTDQVSTLLRGGVTQLMEGIDEVDIFIYAGPSTEFPNIASVFSQLQINAKAAVHVLNNPRSVQKLYNLGQVGNYWIYPTRYDKEFNEGVSGVNGGTTLEFTKDYASRFGYEADFLDALTAAALIPYFYVVNQTHDISAFSVRENIRNMPKIPTFAGYKQYWQNGTNMWARIAPLQLIEGEGRFLTPGNIVYPAPFFPKSKSLDAKKIVAIAVPVGCVLIVAVAIGVFYMHKQRKQVVKALEQAEEGERRNYRIDYSALRMGNPIGAGGFGVVFKGEYRGADVAVKKLKAQKMSKPQLDEFAKESAIMIGLRHPNILLFMGVCIDPPELAIITEFMPYGSVYDIIHNENIALPFPLIKNMMLDVLKGLQFIHSAGIVHRDLKSPNLLVDKSWNIKIADFGLSAMKANTEEDVQISLLWTAPEILKKEANCYSDKSDVFSFAIIAWELMSRQLPYNNMEVVAITPAVVGGVRPPIDSAWDVQVSSLISSCWDGFAIRRPTVVEARSRVEMIFADPTFTIHSSMSLGKYSKDKMTAPSGGAVTFVFTAVFHPTQLWTHDPRSMARALLTHKEVLRDLMKSCKGVEVRSNTDACLFAFGDTIQALNFCLRAQTSLIHASWPETILAHPDAGEQRSSDAELLFRGLSLACGIHCTTATNSIDPDSGDIEYFSKEIGHASFFAGQAAKGWIAMGSDMYVKVMGNTDKLDPFAMDSMGTRLVGGKEITTYQMTAMSLKKRSTHATDVETLDDSPDEITSSSKIPFPGHSERWLINYEDLELREKIGAGSFGEVKLAIYKGKKVAVKQMLRQRMKDESALELQAESIILSSLSHPNVLSFLGVCTQLPNVCLVTEFMERGSLSDVLYGQQSQQLSWDQKIRMIQDIAQGLAFLHGKQIIHRDIKPQNMLVSHDYRVKIADLGFSRLKADNQTMTQVGTVAYSAPEIFGGQHYTEKADVYSFGIIVWEMIFGKKPWDRLHPMKVIPAVSTGQRLPLNNPPTGCPQSLLNLVQECWQHEPASRPAFAAIVNKI